MPRSEEDPSSIATLAAEGPGKVNALLEGLSSDVEASSESALLISCGSSGSFSTSTWGAVVRELCSLTLVTVALAAALVKEPTLEMLVGLVCGLLSTCMFSGIEIALAAAATPSLVDVVAVGASCGLLMPEFWPRRAPKAELAGFWLCFLPSARSLPSRARLSSARAAAAVRGGGDLGDMAARALGDLGIEEAFNPALAMDVRLGRLFEGSAL